METIFTDMYDLLINTINNVGMFGPVIASILIVFESMIPPLPLFVFITINFLAFGNIVGFIISWICTIIGCMLSYYLVKKFLRNWVLKKIKDIDTLNKCIDYMENLSITKITVILAIPFTPAFMMNIAAGIAGVDAKKYFISLLISKIFLIYFWGFIGTSLVESFKNPSSIIAICIMVLISYILSLIVNKMLKIEK